MKKGKKILSLLLVVMIVMSAVSLTNLCVGVVRSVDDCTGGVIYYPCPDGNYAYAAGLCDGDHDGDGLLDHSPVSGGLTIHDTVTIEDANGSCKSYIVNGIGEGAFDGTSINSIAFPNTITTIGRAAFRGTPIKTVSIPNSVNTIGEAAFSGCNDLVAVDINSRVVIGRSAFNSCHNLTDINFEMMKEIGDFAFGYCDNLEDVNLKNVENIGMNAFEFSTIKNMTIGEGDSVTLGGNCFHNCAIGKLTLSANANCYKGAFFWSTQIDELKFSEDYSDDISELFPHTVLMPGSAIKSILVDENNQYYSSVDGVLFNEDKTEIIYYPIAKEDKEYSIPDSVKTVKEGAFAFCDNLEQIKLPKSLECIESNAFYGCNIKEIHIPNSVQEISVVAFYYNFYLTDVYFDGTEEEWGKINFSNKKGYDTEYVEICYPTATIHFNEESIDPPVPEIPEDHTHSFTSGVVVDATCTENGVLSVFCQCGYNYTDIIPAKGHKDANGDYKCDNEGCDYEFEKPAPSDPSEDCTCNCHKSGFMGIIWKILRIFFKIFKINPVCECGAIHY